MNWIVSELFRFGRLVAYELFPGQSRSQMNYKREDFLYSRSTGHHAGLYGAWQWRLDERGASRNDVENLDAVVDMRRESCS